MKILKFIKCSWNKTDAWTRWWLLACGLFGASLGDGNKITSNYLLEGATAIFVGMLLYAVYKTIQSNYARFKTEQQELFTTIKDSDK